jgi:hypothetical protein
MSVTAPYSVGVTFATGPQPPHGPLEMTITQQEFAHDILDMTIWADNVDSTTYQTGVLMQAAFGRPFSSRMFYGYVNHATRSNVKLNPQTLEEANSVTITCVGASWPLKQAGTQSWSNMTASQVVAQIAQQFGLSTKIVPHPTVWPTLQMCGMSYWEFCSYWARKIGYTFYCNGIQLVFKPRSTDPSNLNGYVRSYDYRANPYYLPIFKPEIGANSPSGGQLRNRQMANVNPRTGNVLTTVVSGNPAATTLGPTRDTPQFTQVCHHTVQSQDEANAKLKGEALTNQLYLTAMATSIGDPQISQGSLIFVKNVNGAQDGLWFVEKAQHCFDLKTYVTYLTLGRDSRGATSSISATPPVTSQPTAVIHGGSWVTA